MTEMQSSYPKSSTLRLEFLDLYRANRRIQGQFRVIRQGGNAIQNYNQLESNLRPQASAGGARNVG